MLLGEMEYVQHLLTLQVVDLSVYLSSLSVHTEHSLMVDAKYPVFH